MSLPPALDTFVTDSRLGAGSNMTSAVEADAWVNIVDTTILSLTIIGALSIIGSMLFLEYRGRSATTRMRIVQSLVVSDLALGITGLLGSAMSLSGKGLKGGTVSCDGLGLMLVAVLWTEHLWTLSLAFATYMILIYPLHNITLLLEKRWYVLWALVWVISIAVGVLGYELYGYVPSGGICYYPSRSGLYGELIQFIPRGIVFVFITFFYARLFVFLRRPDKIRSPYSDSAIGSYAHQNPNLPSGRRRKLSSFFKRSNSLEKAPEPVVEAKPLELDSPRPPNVLQEAPLVSPTSEIPPWERVELPAFQVDGQRYGGSSTPASNNMWGNWKGLSGSVKDSKRRPSSPPSHTPRRYGSSSTGHDMVSNPSPPMIITPRLDTLPSIVPTVLDPDYSPHPNSIPDFARRQSSELGAYNWHLDRLRKGSVISAPISELGPITPSASSTQLAGHPDMYDPRIRRDSVITSESRRSSNTLSHSKRELLPVPMESPPAGDPSDVERQRIEAEDDDWDLMRILQQTAPPKTAHDRFAPGDTVEFVEESMASYLNRKTALLMLWFPLGYILLFSVSLVRIIYDFVGRPPSSLRAISRWMIFAQGILDAVIYGLVEWHTKRVVRKRVRKGTFSPGGSALAGGGASGFGSAFRNLGSRRSQQASQIASNNPVSSRLGQTMSFGRASRIDEDPRSILQELNTDIRKASVSESEETRRSGT